jgi:two-component system cell cycle sensor histidine kinase/response regulator CckA
MEKPSLLIVEDEAVIAHEMKQSLEMMGYNVCGVASSIKEALPQISMIQPALALLDIQLNGDTDGIEIAKQIYSMHNIPSIFVTAFTDPETIDRAKQSGAFGFISKPIDYRRLSTTIDFVLYKHEMVNQIKKSEERYLAIVNSIDIVIIRSTLEGEITYANHAFHRFSKSLAQKLSPRKVHNIISEAGQIISQSIASAGSDENPRSCIQKYNSNSGQNIWIQWTKHGIKSIQNQLIELQWIGKDITHFKDEEHKLLSINELLDKEIRLKTEELKEANKKRRQLAVKLADAEKMATMGLFTSIIAHEINNFLSNVFNKMFLLEKQLNLIENTRRCWDFIDSIKQQLRKMSNLTQNILNYVKPTSCHLEWFDLNKMILDSLYNINMESNNQAIEFETDLNKSIPLIHADSLGLEIVFKNIIQNSINAIRKTGHISINTNKAPGKEVVIKISDNGTGIKANHVSRLFDPFFSTRHDKGGTGLGLLLSKKIIDEHQGTIHIESEWKTGTTVTIRLPIEPRN